MKLANLPIGLDYRSTFEGTSPAAYPYNTGT
jgi:hypothetical protein